MKNQENKNSEEYILKGYKTYLKKMMEDKEKKDGTHSFSFFVAALGVIFGSSEAGKIAGSFIKTGYFSPILLMLSISTLLLGSFYILQESSENKRNLQIRNLHLFGEAIQEVMELKKVNTIYLDKDKTFYSSSLKTKMNSLLDTYDQKHFSLTLEYKKNHNIKQKNFDELDNLLLTSMMRKEITDRDKWKVKTFHK